MYRIGCSTGNWNSFHEQRQFTLIFKKSQIGIEYHPASCCFSSWNIFEEFLKSHEWIFVMSRWIKEDEFDTHLLLCPLRIN